jgi:hypothetical protein
MKTLSSFGRRHRSLSSAAGVLALAGTAFALLPGCGGAPSSADNSEDAVVVADAIPIASGQVVRVMSANQNGRAITYRALVVRAAAAPEHDLNLVIQKLAQSVAGNSVKNSVVDQLVIEPSELPGGADATMQADQPLTVEEDGFHFNFVGGASCTFAFDGSGPGTPTTHDFFACHGGAAPRAAPAKKHSFPVIDGVALASGQVIRVLSANQNGRGTTYRALVVRAGAEPEHDLRIVVQRVSAAPSGSSVKNTLVDQLIVEPKDLPGGADATMQVEQPLVLDEKGFRFGFEGGASCSFEFDGSGPGTPATRDFFHCTPAPPRSSN